MTDYTGRLSGIEPGLKQFSEIAVAGNKRWAASMFYISL
jgi:hypothetical protein